jgi:two-component system response regulator HydG
MNAAAPSILVVDDEVDTCRNLADIFADLGYVVDTAYDGESALELVRKRRYDVALLDLMMPGMDGATLYREIKKLRSGTVALIVTAHPGNPRAEDGLGAGVWRLLPKPVDLSRLLGLIEEAMGQPLVLVVDDDADHCANLWDLLRERGYRVCMAQDASTAVHHINDAQYQAILLDMRLPDGDGTQVFRAARVSDGTAQVIVITGCGAEAEQNLQQVLAEGALAVLHKPFDVAGLLVLLGRLGR